jgi:molybdopterin-guanine dinucleotide biosynthesis protein A
MTAVIWDAIVLAGGSAHRMGGTDKIALDVGGRTMLERVVAAVGSAQTVIVVGPHRSISAPVLWCREEPPGSGPASAVAAALPLVSGDVVALLAADQPLLTERFVCELVAAVGESGVVAVDPEGRAQWLCSAWPVALLHAAQFRGGGSLHAALSALPWTPVASHGRDVFDCDTDDDVRRARELAE